ncbi:hypothetical protein [Nonomuraea sp. NPDC003214]
MSEQPYEVSQDLGDDPQASFAAMYLDRLPQRHRIDDAAARGISRWTREEDVRESDAHVDPLAEPECYFE